MKKLVSVVLLAMLVLTGCSSGSDEKKEDKVLHVYMPGSYVDEELFDEFYDETGIKVVKDDFDSNESMLIQLELGKVWDVIIPSDYMVEHLIGEEMLQPLNKNLIENLSELYDGVKNLSFDPNNEYSVPYFWGNVGIVYDQTKIATADVEKQGWDIFHDTKYKGLLYLYDSERDEYMIAQKALGYSMNTTSEDELAAASAWLQQIQDTMEPALVTDEAIDGLAQGEKYLGMMYNGDAAYILSENENARFFVPETGTNYFVDAMCVHKDSKMLDEACEFINFMISYEAQLANSSYVGYSSVNAKAIKELASSEFEGNEAYLPRTRNAKDEEFHYQDKKHREFLSENWAKIKIAK